MSTTIYANRIGDNWQLFCECCSCPVDIVGSRELVNLRVFYAPIMCMDCEGGSDEVPTQLLANSFPYFLTIDGLQIEVQPFGPQVGKGIAKVSWPTLRSVFQNVMDIEDKDAKRK